MHRPSLIAYSFLISLSSTALAQEDDAGQDVELDDRARQVLSGNWAEISERTMEEVDRARSGWCERSIFADGEVQYVWQFDEKPNATDIPVLRDAKANLAIRFNSEDDLYTAQVSLEMTGLIAIVPQFTDIIVRRAGELRMDMREEDGLLGVRFGIADKISPSVAAGEMVPWVRYSVIVQKSVHNDTGETYHFASFPKGPAYEERRDTAMYVKCP